MKIKYIFDTVLGSTRKAGTSIVNPDLIPAILYHFSEIVLTKYTLLRIIDLLLGSDRTKLR